MKFCTKCGAQNLDDAVFCEKCGAKFATPTQPTVSSQPPRFDPPNSNGVQQQQATPNPTFTPPKSNFVPPVSNFTPPTPKPYSPPAPSGYTPAPYPNIRSSSSAGLMMALVCFAAVLLFSLVGRFFHLFGYYYGGGILGWLIGIIAAGGLLGATFLFAKNDSFTAMLIPFGAYWFLVYVLGDILLSLQYIRYGYYEKSYLVTAIIFVILSAINIGVYFYQAKNPKSSPFAFICSIVVAVLWFLILIFARGYLSWLSFYPLSQFAFLMGIGFLGVHINKNNEKEIKQ
jgi:hypothetical protein